MTGIEEQSEGPLEWAICREPQRSQLNHLGTEWIQGRLSSREVALALWKLRVECVMHREAHTDQPMRQRRRWSDVEQLNAVARRWADVDLDIQALAEALVDQAGRLEPLSAEQRCMMLEDKCMFVRDKSNRVDRAI